MNPITPEQREEIQNALLLSRRRNKYIGDYHHSETIDEWIGLLLSSEQVWKSEVEKQRELNDVLAIDNMNAELNLSHMTNLFNQAVEVLKWYADRIGGQNAQDFLSSLTQETLCCNDQQLAESSTGFQSYQYCKSCGKVQKGKPEFTPTGFHACPNCKGATVAQGQYCSVECAENASLSQRTEEPK